MKIIIVTEGGNRLGLGHLERCISLYQSFEKKGITPEVIVNGDESAGEILGDKKHIIFDWMKEKERLFDRIKGSDITVIDSYLADNTFYEEVCVRTGTAVYIDDNKRMDYPKGIVVNGSIYAEEIDYNRNGNGLCLLGTKYIPLRNEFQDVPEKKINKKLKNIMITFGSSDVTNITGKIMKILKHEYPELQKKVVVGKGFQNIKEIERLKDNKTEIIHFPDAYGMKKVMLESDIAVTAGGQTLYELARVGLPSIVIAVAENQLENVKGWQRAGFCKYAGWWEDEEILSSVIDTIELLQDDELRREMAENGVSMVDGRGADITARNCIERRYEESITIREAQMSDMTDVYSLSNESEVRQNSFNQSKIEIDNHEKWFIDKLNDSQCLFLIAEVDNRFLGQVRFHIEIQEAVISISINRDERGFGIGRIINKKALAYLRTAMPYISNVRAYVKEDNAASAGFFEKSGFRFHRNTKIKDQNALEYSYQFKDG